MPLAQQQVLDLRGQIAVASDLAQHETQLRAVLAWL